jgi:phage terminase large subunit-like protein
LSTNRYIPSVKTIEHLCWRKTYFEESNTTPVFHYKLIDHYFTSPSYIKPVKAFRGSAKSTNTCYLALHRTENVNAHYTLIVSDTATQAESLVADVSDMLRESTLPYVIVRDVVGEIELEFQGKRYFIVGKGAGSSMRGIKRSRRRPDLIILDDIINDEMVMNRVRVDRLNRWFYKALLPSLDPDGSIYAVGTPLSQNDLFMHLCSLHPTIEIPLEIGVWRDRFSDEWIVGKKQEYVNAGMLREYKQEFELVLTDDETRIFDIHKIETIPEDDVPTGLTWFCTLDGAFSEKDSADYSAFAVLGIAENGQWYVAPYAMKSNTANVVDKLFELQAKYGFNDVGIEKGSFRLAIQSDIDRRMIEYQQYFSVSELSTNGSKISRIKSLTPVINSRRLTIVDTGRDAELLMEQITMTDNTAVLSSNDDHIDAVCQLLQMNLYYNEDGEATRDDYVGITEEFRSNY